MKLIFCRSCSDMVTLTKERRSCRCGLSAGKYLDEINAVFSGDNAVAIGIGNKSLFYAVRDKKGFEAWVINEENCTTVKKVGVSEF